MIGNSVLLEIKNLRKQLRNFTLGINHFRVEEGEFVGLVGENGAGKTTLLRCIANFITDYEGEILIDGTRYTGKETSIAGKIGYMSEELQYIEDLTVAEHLELAKTLSPHWDKAEANRLIAELRLEPEKAVGRLSRGNRVKLGLTVALSRRARLLLLDEPTSGLDPVARATILRELWELKRNKTSALISSHLLEDLSEVSDSVTILKAGRVATHGNNNKTPANLRNEVLEVIGGT